MKYLEFSILRVPSWQNVVFRVSILVVFACISLAMKLIEALDVSCINLLQINKLYPWIGLFILKDKFQLLKNSHVFRMNAASIFSKQAYWVRRRLRATRPDYVEPETDLEWATFHAINTIAHGRQTKWERLRHFPKILLLISGDGLCDMRSFSILKVCIYQ